MGLNKRLAIIAQNCAIEFCITNDYIIEGQTWNCIDHLLKNHVELFTVKDKKYLKTLNNSYLSLYRVISVVSGKSIILEDMIEPSVKHCIVIDKELSNTIVVGQIITVRLIAIEYKTKPTEYQISNTLILLPAKIALQSVEIIKTLNDAINNPKWSFVLMQEKFEDNAHNRLIQKKIRTKEILEQWYLYYANYMDYHEIFDYEGNPWCPCQIIFDITTDQKEIVKVLNGLPNFIPDAAKKSCNTWIWIDNIGYNHLDFSDMKYKKPNLTDNNKSPIIVPHRFYRRVKIIN
ncbi:hypothetical protein [Candidatus Tisiphia endosymbiont of Nemotelus uliginosus]|uniref:hypothetical protein n=1 Tax=Candidatus Tisiphia endosymbiont of Nemotelus uliginosus TaxID=3077926 RepID=UPI0035C92BD2